MNKFFFLYFVFITIFTALIFRFDKRKAEKKQRRISENTLFLLTLVGGTVGTILGMLTYQHKTSKKSFILKMTLLILFQVLMIYLLFKNNQIPKV